MSSSIRLTSSGAPETPPFGYARIYIEEYNNRLYLKMKRPDGSVEVFGTINLPLEVDMGGTGLTEIPQVGQFLIGTGTGYRLGDIVAGSGVNIVKTETSFEISADISNVVFEMPPEFSVNESSTSGQNAFVVTKVSQNQNTVYAAPTSENGVPTFRFLQVDDIPNLPITKIVNLIETIRAESLLIPVDSADIDHVYDSLAKTLSSTIKSTTVNSGSYGSETQIATFNVRTDGRLDAATNVNIAIPHTQITDFKEAAEDVVGELVENSTSINVEYDDYSNYLKFHVNEEHLITTNVSDTENQRAPTSQAIKQYVDDSVDAERSSRIAEDALINSKLNNFFQNAPLVLDTIVEISNRFEAVEQSLVQQTQIQNEALENEIGAINSRFDTVESDISAEAETRVEEIQRVYDAITAHREEIILTPSMLNSPIPLAQVEQLSHIMPNSVVAFVDRVGMFEGLDFNLSDSQPNQVVLNLTPSILTIIDGSEVLRISYLTKI